MKEVNTGADAQASAATRPPTPPVRKLRTERSETSECSSERAGTRDSGHQGHGNGKHLGILSAWPVEMQAFQTTDLVPCQGEPVTVAGGDLRLSEISGRGAVSHRVAQVWLIFVPDGVGSLHATRHEDQVVAGAGAVARGEVVDVHVGDHRVYAVSQDLPDTALLRIVERRRGQPSSAALLILSDANYQQAPGLVGERRHILGKLHGTRRTVVITGLLELQILVFGDLSVGESLEVRLGDVAQEGNAEQGGKAWRQHEDKLLEVARATGSQLAAQAYCCQTATEGRLCDG